MKLATWHIVVIATALLFLLGTTLYYFAPVFQSFVTSSKTTSSYAFLQQSHNSYDHAANFVWPSRLLA